MIKKAEGSVYLPFIRFLNLARQTKKQKNKTQWWRISFICFSVLTKKWKRKCLMKMIYFIFSYPHHASFMLERCIQGATDAGQRVKWRHGGRMHRISSPGERCSEWRRWCLIPKVFWVVGLSERYGAIAFVPFENWIPKTDWHNLNVQYVPAGATHPVLCFMSFSLFIVCCLFCGSFVCFYRISSSTVMQSCCSQSATTIKALN